MAKNGKKGKATVKTFSFKEDPDEPKPPTIQTNVGFKTTTVRLQNVQFDEVDLFARAINESMAEFIRVALDERVQRLAKDPLVQQGVERQINQVKRMFDRVLKRGEE